STAQQTESAIAHLTGELRWTAGFAERVIGAATQAGLLRQAGGQLELTPEGRASANSSRQHPLTASAD
ncbi:MAG: hypothetical protein ACUVR3_12800, partial [Candidatus Roseilinea sp.]